jgi:hypothetical protein
MQGTEKLRRVVSVGLALAVTLIGTRLAWTDGGREGQSLSDFAQRATSDDEVARREAIEALRSAGPAGLDALFAAHQAELNINPGAKRKNVAGGTLFRQALDAVGGQRDCDTSRLYWYTDLEQAKAAAKQSGKPILSLRLLGKLTDEYSCANSRFFRTALYPNAKVGQALRERFILHWQSERPVPIVTIDFGDGRKLQRTVTGNSVHYILDAEGRPIDALPGLYGPQAFLRGIERAEEICRSATAAGADRAILLARYHRLRLDELEEAWAADQRALVEKAVAAHLASGQEQGEGDYGGCSVTLVKPVEERLASISMRAALPRLTDHSLWEASNDELWAKIAGLHAADGVLDRASANLIARQNPPAARAGARAMTKSSVEVPLTGMIRNFQQTIALDSARNEYVLHRQIHEWFATGQAADLNLLNQRVYAELFLTPSSDPWLGLLPADTYSALEGDGVVSDLAGNSTAH